MQNRCFRDVSASVHVIQEWEARSEEELSFQIINLINLDFDLRWKFIAEWEVMKRDTDDGLPTLSSTTKHAETYATHSTGELRREFSRINHGTVSKHRSYASKKLNFFCSEQHERKIVNFPTSQLSVACSNCVER